MQGLERAGPNGVRVLPRAASDGKQVRVGATPPRGYRCGYGARVDFQRQDDHDSNAPVVAAIGPIDGVSAATSAGPVARDAAVDVVVDRLGVTGWIETYRPSQIIRFGAYHHFVKNVRSWLTVSFLFGRMS